MNAHLVERSVLVAAYQSLLWTLFFPRVLFFVAILVTYAPAAWALAKLAECGWVLPATPRKLFRFVCASILKLVGVSLHSDVCTEFRAAKKRGCVILANHVSYMDTVVLGALFDASFVAKKEVLQWPFIGTIAKSAGCIFVDRKNLQSRVRVLREVSARVGRGETVILFPEGTTTFFGVPSRQRWNAGQIHAAVSSKRHVVSCSLAYENQEQVAWAGRMSLVPHLLKQFMHGNRDVLVTADVLPDTATQNVRELSARVHDRICSMCVANHHKIIWKSVGGGEYAFS
jgi:1-acyl-sn-glycerol-3-phosphate acyltransferase